MIGSFKSACTKHIRLSGDKNFAWQERFYERVIRTDRELENIRHYIKHNPRTWGKKNNLK